MSIKNPRNIEDKVLEMCYFGLTFSLNDSISAFSFGYPSSKISLDSEPSAISFLTASMSTYGGKQ